MTRTMPEEAISARAAVPREILTWLAHFHDEHWSGSLTLHFNKGIVQSYEPKPNLRILV